MAYFNKSSLCILNDDGSKVLVLEKDEQEDATSQFITPGGKFENNESDSECLVREIQEELDVEVDVPSLQFINEYVDVAASDPTKEVSIRMYSGKVIGEPKPCGEIIKLYWIGKEDLTNPRLSPIIKNKILPDLIAKGIIK